MKALETAMIVSSTFERLRYNKVEDIWTELKVDRCSWRVADKEPPCFGAPVYESTCGEIYCTEHAPDGLAEDEKYARDILQRAQEGRSLLTAQGKTEPIPNERALVVGGDSLFHARWNEVERVFYNIKRYTCRHNDEAGSCMRPGVYRSATADSELYCTKHAPRYIEEDAAHILEQLELLQAGVRELRRRGVAVHPYAEHLASIDLDPEEEDTASSSPARELQLYRGIQLAH